MAITSRPASAPAATSSAGLSVPSLAVEWQCRSILVTRRRYRVTRTKHRRPSGVVARVTVLAQPGLDRLRFVHLLDDAQVQLVGVGQVPDLAQRLVLAGRLQHEGAVAEHAAQGG